MIISKRLEDAEFIMSKDELTYSAVIEDFKNASQIHILTYNSIRGILLMIISKRLEDAEFIMSKDELTYSAVIEDFKNASQIHILTYNCIFHLSSALFPGIQST